jgi:alpha-L-rhamnosidase
MLVMVAALAGPLLAGMTTGNLRCEYLTNPVGIDVMQPRLSWWLESDRRGEKQTAYQILVASSAKELAADRGDLWDSGKVVGDATSQVAYAGAALQSRMACFWKVRAWDKDDQPSAWSQPASWTVGLLDAGDWSAKWIDGSAIVPGNSPTPLIRRALYEAEGGGGHLDVTDQLRDKLKAGPFTLQVTNESFGKDPAKQKPKHLRVEFDLAGKNKVLSFNEKATVNLPSDLLPPPALPYLRKSFTVAKPIAKATLYVTALGLYELRLNGGRVGDHILAPEWTDYAKRLRYQEYDVTAMLSNGQNVLGAQVANGWYAGHIGNGGFQRWGKSPALFAQLELTYQDGGSERIVTDETWKSRASPLLATDFMHGEHYDASREIPQWDRPGFNDAAWSPVVVRQEPTRPLNGQVMEPSRELAKLRAKKLTEPKPGELIRVSLRVTLPKDDNRYLVIEDPLPAVFETVNTDFASQNSALGVRTSENDWNVSHSELRSDRAVFFLDHVWRKGTYTVSYLARCTLAGQATAPPAKVESMYDPENFALSASRVFATK